MSQLTPFIRAFRAEAEALAYEANECGDEQNALLLTRLSAAKSRAAKSLEQQIADDLARGPGRQVYHIPTKAEAEDLGPRPAGISPE